MFKISWKNMQGKKCVRQFEGKVERDLFANVLYVNNYDKYGKISVRPTKHTLEKAKAWTLKLITKGA